MNNKQPKIIQKGTEVVHIRFSDKEYTQLWNLAEREHRTIQNLLHHIVADFFERRGNVRK